MLLKFKSNSNKILKYGTLSKFLRKFNLLAYLGAVFALWVWVVGVGHGASKTFFFLYTFQIVSKPLSWPKESKSVLRFEVA